MPTLCKLCLSPYENEIRKAHSLGVSYPRLFMKYAPLMGYLSKQVSFISMCMRHYNGGHKTDNVLTVTPPGSALPVKRVTLENYTKRMLELGIDKANNSTSENVSFKDVNSAVKLSLEASKIKIAENALEMQMTKMFGSEIDPNKIITGEEVKEEDGLHRIG